MKKISAILMASGLVFGGLWLIIGGGVNTIICTGFVIPTALTNPEFDIMIFYENCGR